MKYIDALKIYNEGKSSWCSPRKGSVDYKRILAIMKAKSKSASKDGNIVKRSISPRISPMKLISIKPSSKSLLFRKANVIQRFLKNKLILTKNTLETRIQRYHLIKKQLNDIPSNYCLKRKMFGDNKGFTIEGILNLEKKIGEAQADIYLTSMPHLLGSYPIASKMMEITLNNESETSMNEWITENLILKKQSKHFIMMYKTTKCPAPVEADDDMLFIEDLPRRRGKAKKQPKKKVSSVKKELSIDKALAKNERLVDYNELCNGDLSSLMKTDARNDEMLMYNIMIQALIAIATYQNRVGYCHRDTHHGNFLYQVNSEASGADTGYYHYVYKGLNFYIKSCKYNILLFDFGESNSISNVNNEKICDDNIRVLYSFMSKYNNGWKKQGWIEGELDKKVNRNMMTIFTILQRIYEKNSKNENLDMFQEVINKVLKNIGKNTKIFTTAKPANILNKMPFIINKVEPYPILNFYRPYD
jgi:hypothetical protein